MECYHCGWSGIEAVLECPKCGSCIIKRKTPAPVAHIDPAILAKVLLVKECKRYAAHGKETAGDWIISDGTIVVEVAATGNLRHNYLLAIHELIEATLCLFAGVPQSAVDDFDFGFAGTGEPGDDPASPYHRQHCVATGIEHILCAELGVKWSEYEAAINA